MKSYIGQICYLKFPKAERWIKLSDFEKEKRRFYKLTSDGYLDKNSIKAVKQMFVECFGVEK